VIVWTGEPTRTPLTKPLKDPGHLPFGLKRDIEVTGAPKPGGGASVKFFTAKPDPNPFVQEAKPIQLGHVADVL
jgi:hypothetical protein